MNKKYAMSKRRKFTKEEEEHLSIALRVFANIWFTERLALMECLKDPQLATKLLLELKKQHKLKSKAKLELMPSSSS